MSNMIKSHIYLIDDLISKKDCKILIDFIQREAREETEFNPDTNVKAKVSKLNEEMNLIVKPVINKIVCVENLWVWDI